MENYKKKRYGKIPEQSVSVSNTTKKKFNFKKLLILMVNTVVCASVYFFLVNTDAFMKYTTIIMAFYLFVLTGFIFSYVFYNRGFSQKKVKREMLPPDWSEEAKDTFMKGSTERSKKSEWMLYIIFPFAITLMIEMVLLFIVYR